MAARVPVVGAGEDPRYRCRVGFNPFREHEKTALDIGLVIGALVLTIAAIVWAVAGG